jgi:hypothetical protein
VYSSDLFPRLSLESLALLKDVVGELAKKNKHPGEEMLKNLLIQGREACQKRSIRGFFFSTREKNSASNLCDGADFFWVGVSPSTFPRPPPS